MVLLRQGERHGYALLSELSQFGFVVDQLDPSLVYRALREMEADGWVRSNWDAESQGPKRRIYALADLGEAQLAHFVADLQRTRQEIEALIQMYESSESQK